MNSIGVSEGTERLHEGLQGKGTKLVSIQACAQAIAAQGHARFRNSLVSDKLQREVNRTLDEAKGEAGQLLGRTTDLAIQTVGHVQEFCMSHRGLVERFKNESDPSRILRDIGDIQRDIGEYGRSVDELNDALNKARAAFSGYATLFHDQAGQFRIIIEVQHSRIDQIERQLQDLAPQIEEAIRELAAAGLMAVGGTILIVIGSFLGPWGIPFMIGGAALAVIGVGKAAQATVKLVTLQREKERLTKEKADINSDIALIEGFTSGLEGVAKAASDAATAAHQMRSAWLILGNQMKSMAQRLHTPRDVEEFKNSRDLRMADQWCQKIDQQANEIMKQLQDGDVATAEDKSTSALIMEKSGVTF
ncbi:HBL/NHE enterotoxin family protein [Streptomyces sp. NPDC020792]|uniref:HBL/NHE enterotoxin family protein n=1 Tax=Streptomyces sp. NPDC020792 TaxID=3365089 RepID=UPI00379016CA